MTQKSEATADGVVEWVELEEDEDDDDESFVTHEWTPIHWSLEYVLEVFMLMWWHRPRYVWPCDNVIVMMCDLGLLNHGITFKTGQTYKNTH